MHYRYADGAPFPLHTNFLATVRRVASACAELLRVEDPVDAGWDDNGEAPVFAAVERVLPLVDLPETRSSIYWDSGARAGEGRLIVTESTYFRLEADIEVELGADTVFEGPFRVREVAGESIRVRLPGGRGLLGRGAPRDRCVDRYYLRAAEASLDGDSLTLSRRRAGSLLRVALRGRGAPSVTDLATGERVPLQGDDLRALQTLWQRVIRGMWNRRRRAGGALVGARVDGAAVGALTDPAAVAMRLLGAIAPLCAEILYRGGRTDVLLLHRERDEGRVATLMLPVSELEQLAAALPSRARALFAPLGVTVDAVPMPYVA